MKPKGDSKPLRNMMLSVGSPVSGAHPVKLKPTEPLAIGVTMPVNKHQDDKEKLPPPPKSEGTQGMEIKKPDLQMLLQDHAATQRALADERRNSDKKIAEERETAHWKEARLHEGYTAKLRDLESQIRALLGIIGDLRQQNDQLRIDIAIADLRNRETVAHAPTPSPVAPPGSIPLVNRPEDLQGKTLVHASIPMGLMPEFPK